MQEKNAPALAAFGEGDQQCDAKRPFIEADFAMIRQAAYDREQNALAQQLPTIPARGALSAIHIALSFLWLAHGGHEVGDLCAGDQQHESDGAEKHQ
ncbi:MAG TPA: hypothetical protein VF762_16100 [Blastocatellia bacterium]